MRSRKAANPASLLQSRTQPAGRASSGSVGDAGSLRHDGVVRARQLGKACFECATLFVRCVGVQIRMDGRRQTPKRFSDIATRGLHGKTQHLKGARQASVGGRVGLGGFARAGASVQKVGGAQARRRAGFQRQRMEAHICVLEIEQGIEAQSVLFPQGGQDALGAGEPSANEDFASQPGGTGAEREQELAVLLRGELALLQEHFS